MNRYLYLSTYKKPDYNYRVQSKQIRRGILCSCSPMMIEVLGRENVDDYISDLWDVKNLDHGTFVTMSYKHIVENYVIDEWGGK